MTTDPMSGLENLEWYDSSKIKEYMLCPRRYYWRYVRHLKLHDARATDLAFGSGVHAALETFYHGSHWDLVPCPHETPGMSSCGYCRERNGEIRNFAAAFLKEFPKSLEHQAKTQINALRLLLQYFDLRRSEPFEVEAVEQPFIILIPDGFFYVGKADLIVKWNGKRMPFDHKTTSRFGEMFEKQFRLDIQITGYIYATNYLYPDEKVNSAIINALRVTDRIDRESFMRKVTDRRDDELVYWEAQIRYWVNRIRESNASDMWPMHDFACFAYMRECPYRILCSSHPNQREEIVSRAYTEERWEPL